MYGFATPPTWAQERAGAKAAPLSVGHWLFGDVRDLDATGALQLGDQRRDAEIAL